MSRITALAYALIYLLALPAIAFSLLRSPGQARFLQRFGLGLGVSRRRCIWLHASSVGEVALLEPLVEELQRRHSAAPLLITAFTATGIATAVQRFPDHSVCAAPLDLGVCIRRFIRHFDPQFVVVVESEFWPAFFDTLHRADVPVFLLNGKMSERSLGIHAKTRFVADSLRHVAAAAMLDEANAQRMQKLGVPNERIHVTGNMKYDLVTPEIGNAQRMQFGIDEDAFVIVAGSLHDDEPQAVLDAVYSPVAIADDIVTVLVPRYPENAQRIAELARQRGLRVALRSVLRSGLPAGEPAGGCDVCVVDTFGELRALYAIADAVFVGGSLHYRGSNRGGHNLMEPAICSVPVLFGPYNYSFADIAAELIRLGGGREVRNPAELRAALTDLQRSPELRRSMGAAARGVVQAGQGATARNLDVVLRQLEQGSH